MLINLPEIFGFFMLILIGIELLETIRAYLVENVVHVEVVIEVALIAIARKVIIPLFPAYLSQVFNAISARMFRFFGSPGFLCWRCRNRATDFGPFSGQMIFRFLSVAPN